MNIFYLDKCPHKAAELQLYKDISDLTKAVQKLVKLMEKIAKAQL